MLPLLVALASSSPTGLMRHVMLALLMVPLTAVIGTAQSRWLRLGTFGEALEVGSLDTQSIGRAPDGTLIVWYRARLPRSEEVRPGGPRYRERKVRFQLNCTENRLRLLSIIWYDAEDALVGQTDLEYDAGPFDPAAPETTGESLLRAGCAYASSHKAAIKEVAAIGATSSPPSAPSAVPFQQPDPPLNGPLPHAPPAPTKTRQDAAVYCGSIYGAGDGWKSCMKGEGYPP